MPISKAVLAAFKAASRLKPDIKETYEAQRVAEDVLGKLALPNPRCRIDEASALMPDGYEVPLRVFTPLDIDFSLASGLKVTEDSRGTILFFHGGGWVNGTVDFYLDACTTMALRLERRVVAVDYRRAPEHLVLFGDSAGGNLAAVVSLMARDRGEFAPHTQMLLYPATYNDHDPATSLFESVRENGEDYLLTWRDVVGYMELYVKGPEDFSNPYFAPLLAPDLGRQPRTLVVTAEYCPLRDEGEAYAARLELEGGDVQCYRVLDAVHGYLLYPSVFNIVKDTYRIMKHFLDGDGLEQEDEAAWLELLGTD